MMKILIILLGAFAYYALMMEIVIEKAEISYVNKKYFKLLDFTLRKSSRRSPYILNLYQYYVTGLGNNLTAKWNLYEIISGREILTPVRFETAHCDALKRDPYIGRLFSDYLPKGWVCPFPAGYNNWTDIVINLSYFPFIPFTYSSLTVRVTLTIDGFVNKDPAYKAKVWGTLKQKIQDESKTYQKRNNGKYTRRNIIHSYPF